MKKTSVAALGGALVISALAPVGAAAQTGWVPGTEITGHAVRVDANGTVNTVYFDPGGTARIVSAGGNEVRGTWSVQNQQLCLMTGANVQECWPYRTAFMSGQPVTLTSNCAITSTWTPLSTEPLAPPVTDRLGERG